MRSQEIKLTHDLSCAVEALQMVEDVSADLAIRQWTGKPGSHPHKESPLYHYLPEIRIIDILVETQYPHGDRSYLVMTGSEKAAVTGIYAHNVSLGRRTLNFSHGT